MSDIAIRADGLGKEYHIGAVRRRRYNTLRDHVANAVAAPFRRAGKLLKGQVTGAAELDETFWALRDISFEVARGEVVGVIGHNGAGKSTLLKILSRITEPTTGVAEIHGRVGSLLEVGTGFHPELTGRENIFLNGAILGMTRSEIVARFDEIVAFSEVEKFIDTPVKHYSSGMGLRLAFAVAAHLEPEILIVDEVLAVGDAAFQQKCLGKMGEVAEAGRTVLLVSHNMGAITRLCERALLLSAGDLVLDGPAGEVVSTYLSAGKPNVSSWERSRDGGDESDGHAVLESVRILDGAHAPADILSFDEGLQVEIGYTLSDSIRGLAVLCAVVNDRGEVVWMSEDTDTTGLGGKMREPGTYTSTCIVPARLLRPGRYMLHATGHVPGMRRVFSRLQAVAFEVSPVGYDFELSREGALTPVLPWTVRSGEVGRARLAS
ncbi:ABC transporter ATP-binding protein [Gemmatimonadota bacterium]